MDVVAAVAAAAVAVSWKLGSETVLVFGPESVSYERSRHENWTILREISARVFFCKEIPKSQDLIIYAIYPPTLPGVERVRVLNFSDSQV